MKNQEDIEPPLDLPAEQVFKNLKDARGFAIDIGGSLTKVAYLSTVKRRKSFVCDDDHLTSSNVSQNQGIYKVLETDDTVSRLHFIKFETKVIEKCLDYIRESYIEAEPLVQNKLIKATGGGSFKYKDLITKKLGMEIDKEDEMRCLIKGCVFLLKNIPDESFQYQKHAIPEYKFQSVDHDIFPFLLVSIGSGVSIIKVESENCLCRIGGTSTGGGTFMGLGALLTGGKCFNELIELAERGDHRSVDMLVRDIYGSAYTSVKLAEDVIASSFGKAARSFKNKTEEHFKEEDLIRSLLLCISNDIGQIATLHAQLHGLKKIYFGGGFIRSNPTIMHTLTYAINYWSQGSVQALFLRHEGYLGAIGAFLIGAEEDTEKYCWGENFAESTGSPMTSSVALFIKHQENMFNIFELDRFEKQLLPCPLLLDVSNYIPDTDDLTQDKAARDYWLRCLPKTMEKTKVQAIKSQVDQVDVRARGEHFKKKYLSYLQELKETPCAYGSLTVRNLLDTIGQCLKECMFTDPYSLLKQSENEQALKCLKKYLNKLDSLSWDARQLMLAKGLLAGNVFDWGAQEIIEIMEVGNFGFEEAMDRLQARPWLIDDFDKWRQRRSERPKHKCAVVFCDNSGIDIILGIFPFVQELLRDGTKVILAANSRPSLNDVVSAELSFLVKRVGEISEEIEKAFVQKRLLIKESGQGSPCLDLRLIDESLVEAIQNEHVDLIVLEGMGRSIHTNFHAAFSCDSLKVAVLKNEWLARRLGGSTFSVVFRYERSPKDITVPRLTK